MNKLIKEKNKILIGFLVLALIIGSIFGKKTFDKKDKKLVISKEDVINFNEVENDGTISDLSLRLAFDWDKAYVEEITLEEAFEYLGKDVRPKAYPEDLVEYDGERGDRIVYNQEDNKILLDTIFFSYDGGMSENGYSRRYLNIEVSKLGYQPDCIIYVDSEEMKQSIINGVEMNIGHGIASYGPYDNPDGYYDFFYTEFYNDGVYYKINAESLTKEEFIDILKSLV